MSEAAIDPLALALTDAVDIARQIDPAWRHQVLDLLRAARAVMQGLGEHDTYKQHYAWTEIDDAARAIIARVDAYRRGVSVDEARLLYVHALCVTVRDQVSG